ncbi:MAG: TonB-dependent receptor [Micropepsaceae bacterium]
MTESLLERTLKSALLAGASFAILAGTAIAQETAPAAEPAAATADGAGEEEVTVTGSRLKKPNQENPTSTVVIDALAVELSGEANAADILRQVPQIGVTGLSPTNSNFFTTSQGMNTIDLRNLGTDRTLVLVNGKRFVAGSSGSQVVDINMIPTALIESIDVVTGGASAVYGSDALAGVVNFNLNKNFTGVAVALQGGWNEVYSTNSTARASLTAGSDFADGKGNAVFSVSYDWSGAAYARSRPETAHDCLSLAFFGTGTALEQDCSPARGSGFALGGVFLLSNAAGAAPGAAGTRVIDPVTGLLRGLVATDRFDRQAQRLNLVPLERTNFSAFVNYDVAPGHTLYFEGYYAKSESTSQIEPFPLDSANIYGMTQQVGQQQGIVAGIPLTNPYIPADLLALAVSRGANAIGFNRRAAEFGNRGSESTRSTARFVLGMEGEIGGGWNYDMSYVWGQTLDAQFSNGQVNVANFRNALDAIDLGGGNIVCRDPIARAQGCVPVNLFIPVTTVGNFTQQQLDYLKANSTREQRVEQEVLSLIVDGDLFELPAGAIQAAFGLEYRQESSLDRPDVLSQQGLNGGNKAPVTAGSFDVYEAFAEVSIPLLVDQPWAKELTLHGAARYSDYSTVDTTFAYAADLTWAPTEDIKFRGQYAQAVRAPNIAELYQGPSETFGVVVDPCNNLRTAAGGGPLAGGPTNPTIIANCLANAGIAARANAATGFVLSQTELQGTGGFQGGNPSLTEETATTYTFGFVFTPKFAKWAESLVLSVDYFNIEIEDAIAAVGRNTTIDLCYQSAGLSSPFCGNVIRDVNGAIEEVNTGAANSRTLETSGIDVQLGYRWDLTDAFGSEGDDLGMLTLTVNYQWLNNLTTTVLPGTPFEATTESVGLLGAFRHEVQASLLYEIGDFTLNLDANYTSDAHDFNDPDVYDVPVKIGGKWFFDAQVRYNVLESTTLVFGVRNLTDEFVMIGQGLAEIPTGWATDPSAYDGMGRRFYAGVRLRY